jgi:hypothetical protein
MKFGGNGLSESELLLSKFSSGRLTTHEKALPSLDEQFSVKLVPIGSTKNSTAGFTLNAAV